jgi:hypothetical protein
MKTKMIGITGTAIISVLLGFGASGLTAQEHPSEKQDHAKPQQHEAQPPQQHQQARQPQGQAQQRAQQHEARPQPQQDHRQAGQEQGKPQQRQQDARVPQQRQAPDRQAQDRQSQDRQQHSQQARGIDRSPDQRRVQQSVWQQHRAGNWQADHRTWTQRGGYSGYRIPDDHFRGYFGRNHGFRIGGLPFLVVGGYPRFQYGGYWFSMVDPYPGNWAENWYDTDDVYVNYSDNGYYLYDRRYPGVGIAISVSM